MSDSESEEIIGSDEDEEYRSVGSASMESVPQSEVTVEESGSGSDEDDAGETDAGQDESDDDSDIAPVRRPTKAKRRPQVVESDSDEAEEEIERQALSPRTRMSITGVRPADLSDSESSDLAGISERDEENAETNDEESDDENAETNDEESDEGEDPDEEEGNDDGEMVEQPRRTSTRAVKKNSFIDDAAYAGAGSDDSDDGGDESGGDDDGDDTAYSPDGNSGANETNDSSVAEIEAAPKPPAKAKYTSGGNFVTPARRAPVNTASGLLAQTPPRYSVMFERAMKEKLSSTVCHSPTDPTVRRSPNNSTGDSSDLEVIEVKEKTIEIFSSDESDSKKNASTDKENLSWNGNATPVRPVKHFKTGLVQPKISALLQAPQQQEAAATPARKMRYVSEEFYNKELKKIEELHLDIAKARQLFEKIGGTLPDGGRQLKNRIERLCADMETKKKYVATLKVEPPVGSVEAHHLVAANATDAAEVKPRHGLPPSVGDWDDLSAAVNQVVPKHTGKRGMETHQNQKALTVERLKDLHGSLETCPAENVLADDPPGLKVTLMDHQKHALAWMAWRENQKPRGGILADDMGLGKTLTMISMVLASKQREEADGGEESESEEDAPDADNKDKWSTKGRRDHYRGGTLVVCPASLIRQWESEVESKVKRHGLTVSVHHGPNRETRSKHLRTYDMVVTTYQIVVREEKSHGALYGIKWRRIILDEAHVVRNAKAQMSVAVCSLLAKYRWALTGTPIQNKELDVYALLKFLRCSPFDDLAHWKKWIDNKSAGGQQRLNTLMKSLMLRRTKLQLQERGALNCLPTKEVVLIEVQLDKGEMNVYQKIMIFSRTLFAQFLLQRAERNTDLMYRADGQRPTYMQNKDPNGAYYKVHQKFTRMHQGSKDVKSSEILVLLLRLRQICCHPSLIDAMLEDDDEHHSYSESDNSQQIDLLEQLNKLAITDEAAAPTIDDSYGEGPQSPQDVQMAKASARVLQRSNPVFKAERASSKMVKVLQVLSDCVLNSDDKAIVVSQWTGVLTLLRSHIEGLGIQVLELNGKIAVKDRQEIVNAFNNPESKKRVLLLSLTAGGVGLNLVGANHLLLIDLHWNPQLEAQAQDRIYRVGQKKPVKIYKFMCKDTVEERIKALQDHKMALANGVLTGAKIQAGSKLTIDDLKSLFDM